MEHCSFREDPIAGTQMHPGQSDLRHVSDSETGIRRIRCGKGFRYTTPDNIRLSERDRQRIEALMIPPAWEDVWICTDPRGHIQATGRDDRDASNTGITPTGQRFRVKRNFSVSPGLRVV
jgi:DNA topoisomerase-1